MVKYSNYRGYGVTFLLLNKFLCSIVICCLVSIASSLHAETTSDKLSIQAAFIFNFAKFTRWSNNQDELKTPFNFCIFEAPQIANLLKDAQDRTIFDRKINITTNYEQNTLEQCQVVYYGDTRPIPPIANVLTVSSTNQNAMLLFVEKNEKMSFRVNLEVAKKSGISFHSQLLSLASEISGTLDQN